MTTGIDGLTPCPFCGAGVTRIDEHRHWTGMRYQVLSVEVRHWCAPSGALPRAYISCTGKTTEEAVEKWNTRVHKAAKSEEKPCPDCAEMTKQRDNYLDKCERLERALEANVKLAHELLALINGEAPSLLEDDQVVVDLEFEARRLTAEARKYSNGRCREVVG